MQMRGSTNKSPIKLSMQWKIKYDKNSIRWFLRLPLSKFPQLSQVVKSKGILVPYTNLQLNPYPNTQLDLFSSDNFSFWCTTPSTWLTNCVDPNTRLQSPTREGCWLQSPSVHHTMKIEKLLGYKTLRCTNTTTSSQERWTREKLCLRSQFAWIEFSQCLCNLRTY